MAVLWDIKIGKIPNKWIAIGYITGMIFMRVTYGTKGIAFGILNALWPIALLYVLFLINALGAGDIKLFSVLSVVTDPKHMLLILLLSFFFGAVAATIRIVKNHQMLIRMSNLYSYVIQCFSQKKIFTYSTLNTDISFIEFSPFILLSVVCLLVTEVLGWQELGF